MGKISIRAYRDALTSPQLYGFAAHWGWIWCVFWSPLFYDEADVIHTMNPTGISLEPVWFLSLLSNVLTIGVLLFISYRRNPLSTLPFLLSLSAFLTAFGTLCMNHFLLIWVGDLAGVSYLTGAVATGIGSGMIVVLWGELFATLGSKNTVVLSALACFIAALVYLLLLAVFPAALSQTLVAIFPIVSILLFRRAVQRTPKPARKEWNLHVHTKIPTALIAISLFFGISFGVMKGLIATPDDVGIIELRNALNIVAIIAGSSAAYILSSIYHLDFDHLTYQIALPLMAAGFFFLALPEPWNVLGTCLHQCGYQYFYIVLWAIWPVLVIPGETPAGWIACWGMFSIQAGQLAGSIAGSYFMGTDPPPYDMSLFSSLAIFIILIVALFFLGKRSANTGWGFLKPTEEEGCSSPPERFNMATARRFHLSPRETEVFFLLAKGRNRSYIKDELLVSDETVKSHIKNIYRKMDVHSQQELIDILESGQDKRT